MFKPISAAIGLRYLRAKRRNGFISFISFASMLSIALGVAALITTLAVMSGFQREIRDRMLQMAAHATITSVSGEPLATWKPLVDEARLDPRIVGAAPYIERPVMLKGPREEGALLRGVDPTREGEVSLIAEKMVGGTRLASLEPGAFNIVLGRELALWLGVSVGDTVVVITSESRSTPMGMVPQFKRFTVSGMFEAGHQDFDRHLAVIHLADAQRLLRTGEGVTGVRLKLRDMDQAWDAASELVRRVDGLHRVSDWTRDNANMFRALKLEKTMMAILLSLIIVMGAFTLVNSQVMLVTDKQADIAILRTLGLTPHGVMRVFMVQGSLIGVIGTMAGVVGGILLTDNLENILKAIERLFDIVLIPGDVYYITGLPTELKSGDVGTVALIALGMSFLATLYPAWRAARTAPAEALRYE
ncbi:MAG: lipoprotein-releasing ABC transporter permease subunit [Lysobacteraceae bacterium]|nr:MAG: lipoprotein-releasing ABC transporter permease subunit [Xanthomonadaceae bacterium]